MNGRHVRARSQEAVGASPAADLVARLQRIAKETGDERLGQAVARYRRNELSPAQLNTCLMDNFRQHRSLEAYSAIYELNFKEFLLVIATRLRFVGAALDANDILQDVFVSIFRYPHKFRDEKEFSFRNWSYSIIRNTILKHLRTAGISGVATVSTEVCGDTIEDSLQPNPLGSLVDAESRGECGFLWMLLLGNYLSAYHAKLNDREKLALKLVEVEGVRYREASERLGIKLENLKMVICRARKKIFRTIGAVAGGEP